MDPNFWHDRWQQGNIGFHEHEINPALVDYLHTLKLNEGARIYLPLCGKTLDVAWLLAQGYRVVGVELSALAIDALFAALNITPQIRNDGALIHYSADNIDIWVGDFFELDRDRLGKVDAIYDRAALVALPDTLRIRYATHLMAQTQTAPQLLVSYEYDQTRYNGPPFAVDAAEVARHYAKHYRQVVLERAPVSDGLKGRVDAMTVVWLLWRTST